MKFNDTYRRSSPVFPRTPGWRLGRNQKSPTGTPLGVTASKSVPCPWTRGEGHGRSVKHEKHDKFKGSTEKTVFERFYRIQLIWSIVINSSTRTAFTLMLSFRSSITKPPSPSNSSNVVSLMWMRLAEEVQKYIFTYKLLNLNLLELLHKFSTLRLPFPSDSILDAMLTVSPNRQYLGILDPTTPATTGPKIQKAIKTPFFTLPLSVHYNIHV